MKDEAGKFRGALRNASEPHPGYGYLFDKLDKLCSPPRKGFMDQQKMETLSRTTTALHQDSVAACYFRFYYIPESSAYIFYK
jgi:hypothetical protein